MLCVWRVCGGSVLCVEGVCRECAVRASIVWRGMVFVWSGYAYL